MDGTSTGDSACTSREHQMTDHSDGTEHQKAKKPGTKRSAKLAIIGGTDTQTQTTQAAVSTAKRSVRSATNKLTGLQTNKKLLFKRISQGKTHPMHIAVLMMLPG
jgi:ribosomal protein S6E (S10)